MEESVGFHHLGLDDRLLKVSLCVHYYHMASYIESVFPVALHGQLCVPV